MGRLVLNVLLSFAQFERELISERTRDKIAAARRKGKWVGGMPLLGYDVDPRGSKLVVNQEEARRVRAIFALYLEYQALRPVVEELQHRGWRTKHWQTRKGHCRGGLPFTKNRLRKLLRNATYIGKVRYKQELHAGEHEAIIEVGLWEQVQSLLQGTHRSISTRLTPLALLRGLLYCRPCGCPMFSTHSKRGTKRYRYYVCTAARARGWHTCPSKSVAAGEIERVVLEQIEKLGQVEPSLQGLCALASLPAEQIQMVRQLVERVEYDGAQGKLAIRFRPDGLSEAAEGLVQETQEEQE
jgi:site-specific DNA recombinase